MSNAQLEHVYQLHAVCPIDKAVFQFPLALLALVHLICTKRTKNRFYDTNRRT